MEMKKILVAVLVIVGTILLGNQKHCVEGNSDINDIYIGDCNQDGKINMIDAKESMEYALGIRTCSVEESFYYDIDGMEFH